MYLIGLVAQVFFSARMILQWILSERQKKIVSPAIYWIFSLIGAYLLCIYGWLRNDFSIILGQFISFYVYIWNLKNKGLWKRLPLIIQMLLALTPIVAAMIILNDWSSFVESFFKDEHIPLWLIVMGSLGQIIFTLRFVYQWYYSRKQGESLLPVNFWIISLVGSFTIVLYGLIRLDPILILGQTTGFIVYGRNIMFGSGEKRKRE